MNDPQTQNPQPLIRVGGVPEHFNLPWRLAEESNAFSATGAQVVFEEYPGGTGAMCQALLEDKLDIAIVLTEGAVAEILAGSPLRILRVFVETPLIWGLHVPANKLVHADELEGLPVAISRYGSGSHLMACVYASSKSWDIGAMRFVPTGGLEGARDALRKGEATLFFWEKYMTQPLVDSGEFRRVDELRAPWPAFVVVAREERLAADGKLFHQTLRCVDPYAQRIMEQPAWAAETIAARYRLRSEKVREWLGLTRWSLNFEAPGDALRRVVLMLPNAPHLPDSELDDIVERLWYRPG